MVCSLYVWRHLWTNLKHNLKNYVIGVAFVCMEVFSSSLHALIDGIKNLAKKLQKKRSKKKHLNLIRMNLHKFLCDWKKRHRWWNNSNDFLNQREAHSNYLIENFLPEKSLFGKKRGERITATHHLKNTTKDVNEKISSEWVRETDLPQF